MAKTLVSCRYGKRSLMFRAQALRQKETSLLFLSDEGPIRSKRQTLLSIYRPQYTNFLYFDLYLNTAYATHYVVIKNNFCQLSDARKAGHLHTPQHLDNITYGYYKALYTVEVSKQLQDHYLKNALVISPPIGLKNKFKMKREVTS